LTSATQFFRNSPTNLQVLEGSEALLRCEINNLAGSVQWVKDGFALGEFMNFLSKTFPIKFTKISLV
jgi:hypothetical protein